MEELVSMVITNKDQLLPKSKIILRLISKVPGRGGSKEVEAIQILKLGFKVPRCLPPP